jgi:hypothetical protein
MWKSRFMLAICAAFVAATAVEYRTQAQADPTTLPRIHDTSLDYLGAFRLPNTASNGHWFSFAHGQLAIDPAGNAGNGSIFVTTGGGLNSRIAEVTLEEPIPYASIHNLSALNMAEYIQPFSDPTEGNLLQVYPNDIDYVGIRTLMLWGDRLVGAVLHSYDANNNQRLTHFSRSKNLAQPSFSGWSAVWETAKAGWVAGSLAAVPAEWQNTLETTAVTGNCCVSIVSRSSWGPAALGFDPTLIGTSMVPAFPLLFSTIAEHRLEAWDNPNPSELWGQTAKVGGLAMINGTRTALFFGSLGTGEPCYGVGTSDPSKHKKPIPEGSQWCYDPTNTDAGNHAYPYRFQIWAYDLKDLADVRRGVKQPEHVEPYGVWPLGDLPSNVSTSLPNERMRPGGVAYVPQTQRLYVVTDLVDVDGYSSRPLIHVYRVDLGNTVNSVAVTADRSSPQPPNTTIRFTATAAGGVAPYQYQWRVFNGATWNSQPWGGSHTFDWTPSSAGDAYKVAVDVRSAGSSGAAEASDEEPFVISGSATVTAAYLTHDLPQPRPVNTTITWTGGGAGGVSPLQFKFWVQDPTGTWTLGREWSTSNTFAWTPTTAGTYSIAVWVRSAGNTEDYFERSTQDWYVITSP